MKIAHKAYSLIVIVVITASINLFLLSSTQKENESDIFGIVAAQGLDVTLERILGLTNSISSGNVNEELLLKEIAQFDKTYWALSTGGTFNGKIITKTPDALKDDFAKIGISWNAYKRSLLGIQNDISGLKNLQEDGRNLSSLTLNFANLLDTEVGKKLENRTLIIRALLGGEFAIFVISLYSIKRSLSPLNSLVIAISQVKEGIYGTKIEHASKDEIGELAKAFNVMSFTIKEKEDESKKMEISKNEFLAMMTHELKTPLVPIQGYADILLKEHLGQLNQSQKERIGIIRSSATSLLSLISDLLDAQKLELKQLKIKKEINNIKSTIENTVAIMNPQALADEIELTCDVKNDIYVTYDEDRICQVLTNLIKNSLKFVPQKDGKISILVEDSPNEIKISVKDNGKGIPKEAFDGIFKKFFQVDTSSTREKGGTGLGLNICKGIVEVHGGKIWFETELGKGTIFTFSIPKGQEPKSDA